MNGMNSTPIMPNFGETISRLLPVFRETIITGQDDDEQRVQTHFLIGSNDGKSACPLTYLWETSLLILHRIIMPMAPSNWHPKSQVSLPDDPGIHAQSCEELLQLTSLRESGHTELFFPPGF